MSEPLRYGSLCSGICRRGRLNAAFVEWMMGFPEGWTAGLSRAAALRCLGNAVVPEQGHAALSMLRAALEEEAPVG